MTDKVLQIDFSDGTPSIVGNDNCLGYMLFMKMVSGHYGIFIESCDPDEEAMLKGILAAHGIGIRTTDNRSTILTLIKV